MTRKEGGWGGFYSGDRAHLDRSFFTALRVHQILTGKWDSGELSGYLLSHSSASVCFLLLYPALHLSTHLPQQR